MLCSENAPESRRVGVLIRTSPAGGEAESTPAAKAFGYVRDSWGFHGNGAEWSVPYQEATVAAAAPGDAGAGRA